MGRDSCDPVQMSFFCLLRVMGRTEVRYDGEVLLGEFFHTEKRVGK